MGRNFSICHPNRVIHGDNLCRACYSKEYRRKRKESGLSTFPPSDNAQLKYHVKKYGLTVPQYQAIWWDQGGVCYICQEVCSSGQRLSIDHDHVTGKIRGLLCRNCNTAIGRFKDRPELLKKAWEYLIRTTPSTLHDIDSSVIKRICIDFDGVISPWAQLFAFPEPNPGAVDAIQRFNDAGYEIIVLTSRLSPIWLEASGQSMGEHIRYLTEYLDRYQIKVTGITAQKVPALAYIDDRAIHFNGNWNQVTAEVLTRLT